MQYNTYPREVRSYLQPTPAMRLGAPGKCGRLQLIFELDRHQTSILRYWERQAPLIVQQELYFDECMPEMPCVYILSSGGPHVDGDRYEQRFTLRKGAYAFVSTGAATKIAEMIYNFSSIQQHFHLEAESYLEYLPEALIPCRHSRLLAESSITIHPSATLLYGEIYSGGRKYYNGGELFCYDLLSVCTRAQRPDGTPLFREKMVITPHTEQLRQIGLLSHYDVFANLLVLTPPAQADVIYQFCQAQIQQEPSLAIGISRLPHDAGLLFKVLGQEIQPVKKAVRTLASTVRQQIKGKPLPEEFIWK